MQTLQRLGDLGVRRFIEIGPKSVLKRFVTDTFGAEDGYQAASVDPENEEGLADLGGLL